MSRQTLSFQLDTIVDISNCKKICVLRTFELPPLKRLHSGPPFFSWMPKQCAIRIQHYTRKTCVPRGAYGESSSEDRLLCVWAFGVHISCCPAGGGPTTTSSSSTTVNTNSLFCVGCGIPWGREKRQSVDCALKYRRDRKQWMKRTRSKQGDHSFMAFNSTLLPDVIQPVDSYGMWYDTIQLQYYWLW